MAGGPIKISLPGRYNKRVFIGGDYVHCSLLQSIQLSINSTDSHGILAIDYVKPGAERQISLYLLSKCKYAIFEVSTSSGQLIEIEHIDEAKQKVLFLWDAMAFENPIVTRMLQSGQIFKNNSKGYVGLKNMEWEVINFLNRNN